MRLNLIKPENLINEQKPLYEDMKKGIEGYFKGFTAINNDGALIGPWTPFLHYPQFGSAVWELIKAIAFSPKLPKSVREIAILVVGTRFQAPYELYAHIRVALLQNLSEEKISTIVAGQRPSDLTYEERIAYDISSALVAQSPLPKPCYDQAVTLFGKEGVGELIYLVGTYTLVSVILNGFNVPVPGPENN